MTHCINVFQKPYWFEIGDCIRVQYTPDVSPVSLLNTVLRLSL